jgi:3D (Asp-Asp-Asp) domain-containing protein
MTQVTVQPSLLKRVCHIAVVAVCTASSLALLGAVPAQWAKARRSPATPKARLVSLSTKAPVRDVKPAAPAAMMNWEAELLRNIIEPEAPAVEAVHSHIMRMEVTAYCHCSKCCGPNAQGLTASGKPVSYNGGKFVAADTTVLGFGTQVVIPGYAGNAKVEVIDRGGAIKGKKLDLYFPTHEAALAWGRQQLDVTVYE